MSVSFIAALVSAVISFVTALYTKSQLDGKDNGFWYRLVNVAVWVIFLILFAVSIYYYVASLLEPEKRSMYSELSGILSTVLSGSAFLIALPALSRLLLNKAKQSENLNRDRDVIEDKSERNRIDPKDFF